MNNSGEDNLEIVAEQDDGSHPSVNDLSMPVHAGMTDSSKSLEAQELDSQPERDRIVILGRRQSGKTIFLARVYDKLWHSQDGLTAKALSGATHRQLMLINQELNNGQWPDATLGASQVDLEIEYHQRKRLMVTLDFAGEIFRKAFIEELHDMPGVKELLKHIDRAAAVVILIDPSVAVGKDHDAAMDDDFGIVQAIQRILNWPGGETVPIVLVLTKMDIHQQLMDRYGGTTGFVRKNFPALVRLLKQIPIFQVSAVQSEIGPDGKRQPKSNSAAINVINPLRFCLRQIEKEEVEHERQQSATAQSIMAERLTKEQARKISRQNKLLVWVLATIFVIGIAVAYIILRHKF